MNLKTEKGASLVEFVIVLPVLLLLVFGTIEFGLLLFNKQVITNASREGARFGIVSGPIRKTDAQIMTVVDQYTQTHLITLGPPNTPVVTPTRTGTSFGDDLTVRVQYHFDFLVLPNFITSLTGGQNIVASTLMKYE